MPPSVTGLSPGEVIFGNGFDPYVGELRLGTINVQYTGDDSDSVPRILELNDHNSAMVTWIHIFGSWATEFVTFLEDGWFDADGDGQFDDNEYAFDAGIADVTSLDFAYAMELHDQLNGTDLFGPLGSPYNGDFSDFIGTFTPFDPGTAPCGLDDFCS